jgi:dUTP pyrophosphatase
LNIKENIMLDLKFKKLHEDAVLPFYGSEFAAGMDCVTVTDPEFEETYVCYKLGFAMEIPAGHVGLLFPRSSNSKKDLLLSNSVGVIDEDYRGEVQARFRDVSLKGVMGFIEKLLSLTGIPTKIIFPSLTPKVYSKGDAVCQLIIIPVPKFNAMWAEELSDTVRGEGGFGHTGN